MLGQTLAARRGVKSILFIIASVLLSSLAFAQSDAETLAELRECARVDIDRARWNCFDGVFAKEGATLAAGRAPLAQAAPAAPPASVPPSARTAPPAAAASAASPAPAAAPAAVAAASPEPEFRPSGRSRRVAVEPATETESKTSWIVTVVEMMPRLRGNLRFVTADGEIYTQPYGEPRGRYPEVPFEAQLETGAMGSYFIKPLEQGPRTRVSLSQ